MTGIPASKTGSRRHKQIRQWFLARYVRGVTRCAIGGEILTQPGKYLDLAHSDDGRTYLGLACRPHNRGDADGRAGGNPFGGKSYGRKGGKTPRVAGQRKQRSTSQAQRRTKLDDRERERQQRRLRRKII